MDLFEILFIALFILFPILEGVLKQRRKGKGTGPEGPGTTEEGEGPDAGWSEEGAEPRSASDMVPDDLWELMTGEQKEKRSGAGAATGSEAPWSVDPDEGAPVAADGTGLATEAPEDWRSESWVVDEEADVREPESLEYQGPEAYSLETPAPEPIERKVPTAEARHRAFHELIDRPKPRRKRRMSPLVRALHSREGLRQAVLLKEVLGPPKGLE